MKWQQEQHLEAWHLPALPSALHRGLQELGKRDCSTGQDGAQPGQLTVPLWSICNLLSINRMELHFLFCPPSLEKMGRAVRVPETQRGAGANTALRPEKRRGFPQKSPDIQTCSEPSSQGLSSLGLSTEGGPNKELPTSSEGSCNPDHTPWWSQRVSEGVNGKERPRSFCF